MSFHLAERYTLHNSTPRMTRSASSRVSGLPGNAIESSMATTTKSTGWSALRTSAGAACASRRRKRFACPLTRSPTGGLRPIFVKKNS
eukprot:9994752-Lingulodinium_polyedra.AAC.1